MAPGDQSQLLIRCNRTCAGFCLSIRAARGVGGRPEPACYVFDAKAHVQGSARQAGQHGGEWG